jgi:hypothetical protein
MNRGGGSVRSLHAVEPDDPLTRVAYIQVWGPAVLTGPSPTQDTLAEVFYLKRNIAEIAQVP